MSSSNVALKQVCTIQNCKKITTDKYFFCEPHADIFYLYSELTFAFGLKNMHDAKKRCFRQITYFLEVDTWSNKILTQKQFLRQTKHRAENYARFLKISTFLFSNLMFRKTSPKLANQHKMMILAMNQKIILLDL